MMRRGALAAAFAFCVPQSGIAQPEAPETVAEYTVSAEETEILVRVYRAGPLARLGHNHVITATSVEGDVRFGDGQAPRFEVRIPVDSLVVDDAEIRSREGEDFDSEPSERNIAGTRENMLGPDVLDAAAHPFIVIDGTAPEGVEATSALVRFLVKAHAFETRVPIRVTSGEGSLRVSGDIDVSHGEVGLEPFTVMGGALRVAERLSISFVIVAIRD